MFHSACSSCICVALQAGRPLLLIVTCPFLCLATPKRNSMVSGHACFSVPSEMRQVERAHSNEQVKTEARSLLP